MLIHVISVISVIRGQNTYLGRHIKGQLIRSGTSVAANYRAAKHGQTKAVFISKLAVSC